MTIVSAQSIFLIACLGYVLLLAITFILIFLTQAHFKTIDTISTFFRNYLVIVSIPISLIAILVVIFAGSEVFKTIMLFRIPLSFLLLAVSFAGVGVLLYIVNLLSISENETL